VSTTAFEGRNTATVERATFVASAEASFAESSVKLIEDGDLRALRVRGEYKIPYREVTHFFMRQQGAMN
jgi:hypothetical protein